MPASLSKFEKQDKYTIISYEDAWYLRSRDNPRDIINTPHQQELKQWKKVINGVHRAKKVIKEVWTNHLRQIWTEEEEEW